MCVPNSNYAKNQVIIFKYKNCLTSDKDLKSEIIVKSGFLKNVTKITNSSILM